MNKKKNIIMASKLIKINPIEISPRFMCTRIKNRDNFFFVVFLVVVIYKNIIPDAFKKRMKKNKTKILPHGLKIDGFYLCVDHTIFSKITGEQQKQHYF